MSRLEQRRAALDHAERERRLYRRNGNGVRLSIAGKAPARDGLLLRATFGRETLAETGWTVGDLITYEMHGGGIVHFIKRGAGAALHQWPTGKTLFLNVPIWAALPACSQTPKNCDWRMVGEAVRVKLPAWRGPAPRFPKRYFKDDPRALGPKPVWNAPGGPQLPTIEQRRSGFV
jgi:hypothetical protein